MELIRIVSWQTNLSERTEESSASQYFQFYGYLSQQQNMMQDFIRTSTYQKAILDNPIDFNGKVVLDVGAGSALQEALAGGAGQETLALRLQRRGRPQPHRWVGTLKTVNKRKMPFIKSHPCTYNVKYKDHQDIDPDISLSSS